MPPSGALADLRLSVELSGNFFRQAPSKTIQSASRAALEEMLRATVAETVRNTPRKTGRLQGSIYGFVRRPRVVGSVAGGATVTRGVVRSRLSDEPPTSYVTWIERGTRRPDVKHPPGRRMFAKAERALRLVNREMALEATITRHLTD